MLSEKCSSWAGHVACFLSDNLHQSHCGLYHSWCGELKNVASVHILKTFAQNLSWGLHFLGELRNIASFYIFSPNFAKSMIFYRQASRARRAEKRHRVDLHLCFRAGHFNSLRASAQAILVLAIFSVKSALKASTMSSGGPPSMISLSGSPWLSNLLKLRGRDKLT